MSFTNMINRNIDWLNFSTQFHLKTKLTNVQNNKEAYSHIDFYRGLVDRSNNDWHN